MYIERSLAIARMLGWGEPALTDREIKALLEEIPAADVAPVVRCRDCKYYVDCGTYYRVMDCVHPRGLDDPEERDFCSRGDRRDSNAESV